MVILLIVRAISDGLIILTLIGVLAFPFEQGQTFEDNPSGVAALSLYSMLTILRAILYVGTVIVFLMWLHRSFRNLPAFGHWKSQGYSPAWAVGSFFVPFVNLVVPYQATKELWQKSLPANSESFSLSSSPPGFFPAWWCFWLISNFLHFRMSRVRTLTDATIILGIISEVLSIAAAAFAIQVVKAIDQRQVETIKHVRPGDQLPGPPPPPVFEPSAD